MNNTNNTNIRKSYPAAIKRKVIEFTEINGNAAAERNFNVSECNVRRWRKNKEVIRETLSNVKTQRLGISPFQEVDYPLKQWVMNERASFRPVSTLDISVKAKCLADELGIIGFTASSSWVRRFMKRCSLSLRARTSLGQKLPDDYEKKIQDFRDFCIRNQPKNSQYVHIGNMDELPLSFDIPPNKTVDEIGKQSIVINTTGHEKMNFTVVLSVCLDGSKLKPMVIFKRKTNIREKMTDKVIVCYNEKGWMNEKLMCQWLQTVWRSRPQNFFHTKSMLILVCMTAHKTSEVLELMKRNDVIPAIIPGGLTKKLQPLDISVNKPFKNHMRQLWRNWMASNDHTYTNTGRMRRASYAQICSWVYIAWDRITKDCIINGFKKAQLLSGIDSSVLNEDEAATDDEDELEDPNFYIEMEDEDFDGF